MINLSTDGASLIFEFDGAQHYLWDGTMNVPLNALTVVFDESDMVTFRKANDDILLSANINEFDGFDKDSLKQWLQENAYGAAVSDGLQFKVVTSLPTVGSTKIIYLLKTDDNYEQWVWQDGRWIMTGEMNTQTYQGKDAIKVEKINTGDSATTIYWKIKSNDKFLKQDTSGATALIDIKYEKENSGDVDESGHTIYNHFLRLYGKDLIHPVRSIDINDLYRDNYLVDVDYDEDEQELILTFKLNNHYQKVKVPIPTLYKGEDAIDISRASGESAYTVSLVIDPESNSAITQGESGLCLTVRDSIRIYSASTYPAETRAIWREFDRMHFLSGETESSTTYNLINLDDEIAGERINRQIEIPNAEKISAVTVDDENQQILIDIVKPDKTLEQLSGDATPIIFEDDIKDGLEVVSGYGYVNVKIDEESDSGLTVSSGGVKMNADELINSASTNAIENREVWRNFDEIHITSAETISSITYTLNVMDVDKEEIIEVPNDQYVSAVTVDDENQQILLDLVKADGSIEILSGDATNIIFEDDVKDGLKIDDHLLKVKLKDNEKILTVDINGLKDNARLSGYTDANDADHIVLSGFSEIIDDVKIDAYSGLSAINIDNKEVKLNIKEGEKILKQDEDSLSSVVTFSAVTSLDNGVVDHTLHLKGIDDVEIDSATTFIKEGDNIGLSLTSNTNTIEISGRNYTIITSLTGTGKSDTLYLLRETDGTAVTYSQYAYIGNAWVQVSAKGIAIVELTQAEYEQLPVKDQNTIYIITDAAGFIIYANALPTSGQTEDALYLLRKTYQVGGAYDEPYTYVNDAFVPIDIDLTDVVLDAGTF